MSEPTEGNTSSGPAPDEHDANPRPRQRQRRVDVESRREGGGGDDAILDLVDERAPFEPDGNVATIIFSHIADVQTRGALTMASKSWRDASRLLASLPKHSNGRLNLDGLSEEQIDQVVAYLESLT